MGQFSIRTGAAALIVMLAAGPAPAFELFGITLFGQEEDSPDVRVINPLEYQARLDIGSSDGDLRKAIRRSSELWQERRSPAPGSAGLITRARGDYRTILAALYSEGRYAGAISIRLNGREAAELDLTTRLAAPVNVAIRVDPGPPFRFGSTAIRNAPPVEPDGTEPLLQSGSRARADEVSVAGDQAIEGWRSLGYPVARVANREVIADHATNRLDVRIDMDPGPRARISRVDVGDTGRVDPIFVRYMADIPEGSVFDPQAIERAEARLNRLNVFRAVRITEAETVAADGTIPLMVETLPRKRRRYGLGATLSSIEGLGLQGYWLHRNLAGRAERLRFDGEISGIGAEGDPENYDYFLGVSFTRPGILTPDTDFETGASLSQDVFDTYRERKVQARAGLTHIFSDRLSGEGFFDLSYTEVEDDLGLETYLTASVPLKLTHDLRDSDLNPKSGYFLEARVQPFHEFEFGSTGLRNIVEGRYYLPVDEDGRTVLAVRARIGSIIGGNRDELPPSLLFFTGGGGSVRGYGFRSNGLEVGGDIVGGRSSLELAAEVRQEVTESFSIVGFADAGLVSGDVIPSGGDNDLKVGVGAGLRYLTGLGPIRFDVARPLDPGPDDPDLAFYFGIGQAF